MREMKFQIGQPFNAETIKAMAMATPMMPGQMHQSGGGRLVASVSLKSLQKSSMPGIIPYRGGV